MQFTLYCQLKGNKPDYRRAMAGEQAKNFYHQFIEKLATEYTAEKIKGIRSQKRVLLSYKVKYKKNWKKYVFLFFFILCTYFSM